MIRNGKDIATGTVVPARVCVIGTGPAGVTVAWQLQKAGYKVTLIEGSRDFRQAGDSDAVMRASWPDKVKLYNGKADGQFSSNEPQFLILPYGGNDYGAWERERVYGGTSIHWGGQSRPLDPITFEKREGFPGWPIDRKELDPFYAEAAKFCALYSDDFTAEYWAKVLGAEVPHLKDFDAEMYQFIGPNYRIFSTRVFDGQSTIGDSACDVILNASLTEIVHADKKVSAVIVQSMDDQSKPATKFKVEADVFVLACGAVANARQLLLSEAGNGHDQVGRYFMCHPLASSYTVTYRGRYLTDPQKRLMNGQTTSAQRIEETGWSDGNGVTVTGRFSPTADVQRDLKIGSCWFWASYGQYYFEMAPNPESRVRIDRNSPDPVFNQAQTHITWQLSDRDQATYEQTTRLFKAAVQGQGLGGDVDFLPWTTVKSQLTVNGHHIGTTRMSDTPETGVVDKNLKVHSLSNLYVAGASVFASAGISNPTFTIITLSLRLAKHLRDVLGK